MCSTFRAILWLIVMCSVTIRIGCVPISNEEFSETNKTSAVLASESVSAIPKRRYKIEILTTKTPRNGLQSIRHVDTFVNQTTVS